jgi:hypothetical protein
MGQAVQADLSLAGLHVQRYEPSAQSTCSLGVVFSHPSHKVRQRMGHMAGGEAASGFCLDWYYLPPCAVRLTGMLLRVAFE